MTNFVLWTKISTKRGVGQDRGKSKDKRETGMRIGNLEILKEKKNLGDIDYV